MAVVNYHPRRRQRYIRRATLNDAAARAYLIKRVNDWLSTHPNKPFMAMDLVGHDHGTWAGTPIDDLYQHHSRLGKHNPVLCAGIECGWLLLEALQDDPRTFSTPARGYRRSYRLV